MTALGPLRRFYQEPADAPRESLPMAREASVRYLTGSLALATGGSVQASLQLLAAARLYLALARQSIGITPAQALGHGRDAIACALRARAPSYAETVLGETERLCAWDRLDGDPTWHRESLSDLRDQVHTQRDQRLESLVRMELALRGTAGLADLSDELLADLIGRFPGEPVFHWAAFRRAESLAEWQQAERVLRVVRQIEPNDARFVAAELLLEPRLRPAATAERRCRQLYMRWGASSGRVAQAFAIVSLSLGRGRPEFYEQALEAAAIALREHPGDLSAKGRVLTALLKSYCAWKLSKPGVERPPHAMPVIDADGVLALPPPDDAGFEDALTTELRAAA